MTSKDTLYGALRILPKKVNLLYRHYSFSKYNLKKCDEDVIFFGNWKDLCKVSSLFYRDKHLIEYLEGFVNGTIDPEYDDAIYIEKLSYLRSRQYCVFNWIISVHEKGDYKVVKEKGDISLLSDKDSIFDLTNEQVFEMIKRGNFTVLE